MEPVITLKQYRYLVNRGHDRDAIKSWTFQQAFNEIAKTWNPSWSKHETLSNYRSPKGTPPGMSKQ